MFVVDKKKSEIESIPSSMFCGIIVSRSLVRSVTPAFNSDVRSKTLLGATSPFSTFCSEGTTSGFCSVVTHQ